MATGLKPDLIHHADGRMEPTDPMAPFRVEGTKVRMINSALASSVGCSATNGETGFIDRTCVEYNGASYNTNDVYVYWDRVGLLYCQPEALEVIE